MSPSSFFLFLSSWASRCRLRRESWSLPFLAAVYCRSPSTQSPSHKLTLLLRLSPIVAARLFYLSPRKNSDPTLTNILPHILTEGCLEYAVVSTSITALKPFLKPFDTGAFENTVCRGDSGLYSRPRTVPGVYVLSAVAGDKNNNAQTTVRSIPSNKSPKPRLNLYTGSTGERTAAVSSRGEGHRDDIESVESNGSEQIIIRETKEWAVRYEQQWAIKVRSAISVLYSIFYQNSHHFQALREARGPESLK